ncbi:hypothetical protein J583_3145 [Acinetobacter baumannii 83444]|nr:hypothetical protein J583_3145 [Acinetobacter baumannii 83444]
MLNLGGLPLAGTCIFNCSTIKSKVDHEMPVYRLNCVSESFFESMYFIRRLCMNIENFSVQIISKR